MKTVRINFTDFPGEFNPTRIRNLLNRRFNTQIDDQNPEFVIYSVTGNKYLQYPNAIRIFFTGENVHPDFNFCDYAFAYDWLDFGDRYYRCPNYQLYDQFNELCQNRSSKMMFDDTLIESKEFCNFIYTNGDCHPFRDQFFHILNQYRRVDSPGAHLRNMAGNIGPAYQGDWSASKVIFQQKYKFSFAFENSSTIGYTTEKIVHALAANTIPIYWGNPDIAREFNSRRFINCHAFSNIETAIHRIKEIDQNNDLYRSILLEPFFPENKVPRYLQDDQILDQFENIFSKPKDTSFKRNIHAWGKHYERRRIDEAAAATLINGRQLHQRIARLLLGLRR